MINVLWSDQGVLVVSVQADFLKDIATFHFPLGVEVIAVSCQGHSTLVPSMCLKSL